MEKAELVRAAGRHVMQGSWLPTILQHRHLLAARNWRAAGRGGGGSGGRCSPVLCGPTGAKDIV